MWGGIIDDVNQGGKRNTGLIVAAVALSIVLLAGIGYGVLRYTGDGTSGSPSAVEASPKPSTRVNSAPSPKTTDPAPAAPTLAAPAPIVPPQPVLGDLGLWVPMTAPACDGTGIVVIHSAVDPERYVEEISAALSANPGSQYLRTDAACPSLRQQTDGGNAIYAVYRPAGRTPQAICEGVAGSPAGSYGKWLDRTTDPSFIVGC